MAFKDANTRCLQMEEIMYVSVVFGSIDRSVFLIDLTFRKEESENKTTHLKTQSILICGHQGYKSVILTVCIQ